MNNQNDFNSPEVGVDQVIRRANSFVLAWDKAQRHWRSQIVPSLAILTFSTIALTGGSKIALKGDWLALRPWVQLFGYGGVAGLSLSLSDAIRYRRESHIGYLVTAESRITASEDTIEMQSERKFHPYGSSQGQSLPSQSIVDSDKMIPEPGEENAAKTIANSKLPVLIVGGTGSGKTSIIERIIYEAYKAFPESKIVLFDGKPTGDRSILGIKTQKGQYYFVASYRDIPRFYSDIDRIGSEMAEESRGQSSQKMFVIVDELNNAIRKADKFRLEERAKQPADRDNFDYAEGLQIGNDLIISQGREKNCVGIATTHDAGGKAMGQSMAMRSNQGFIILGSPESVDNIEIILSGTGAKLIQNPQTLARLQEQYETHREKIIKRRYALTNIGGDWRLIYLPDWSVSPADIWTDETVDSVADCESQRSYSYRKSSNFVVSLRNPAYKELPPELGDLEGVENPARNTETNPKHEKIKAWIASLGDDRQRQFYAQIKQAEEDGVTGKTNLIAVLAGKKTTGETYQKFAKLFDHLVQRAAIENW